MERDQNVKSGSRIAKKKKKKKEKLLGDSEGFEFAGMFFGGEFGGE